VWRDGDAKAAPGTDRAHGRRDLCFKWSGCPVLTRLVCRGLLFSLQVEYYPDEVFGRPDEDMISGTENEPNDEACAVQEDVGDAKVCDTADAALVYPKIADSLANLGFHARSMKPPKAWWHQGMSLLPKHH